MPKNSPTSTFNFKNFFRGLYPWTPIKREGERGREGRSKGGGPPIHIPGYAAVSAYACC